MATRNVTTDAQNADKTSPTLTDKVMVIDVSTNPDSLKESTLQEFLNVLTSLTAKTSLVDADQLPMVDSAASNVAKKITWANVLATTGTFTNKRITKRAVVVAQSATPTINTDNADIVTITGLAQAITSLTTNLSGTPTDGQMLLMKITDNGTARAITPGASFAGTTAYAITALTTVISKELKLLWMYSSAVSKWELVGNMSSL